MTGKPQLPHQRHNKKPHLRRHRVAQAVLLVSLVTVPLGIYMYQHRELDIYHQDMELLVEKDREGAEALKASIRWLQKAAASDPEDLAEIGTITDGLQQWEALARQGDLSSAELHQQYITLDARVQRLIKKRARAPRDN